MNKWVKGFTDLINKDVVNRNESKKNAVMTRCICAVMFVYCIIQFFFMLHNHYGVYSLFPLGFLGIYAAAFYLTYSSRTVMAFYLVIILGVGWCFLSTDLFGWNTGAQYVYPLLLVYIFNGTHRSITRKIVDAGILAAVGTVTFAMSITGSAVFLISRGELVVQETLNMLSTFFSLGLITVIFSKDTLDAEKKLMEYNREMTHQAETDALTGLMNRRAGEKYFKEICRTSAKQGFFINVAMGDIDFFKKVNDTYGHDAGDDVLKALAEVFKNFVEQKGAAVRWGGEEFLFVLIGMNADDAAIEMEHLRETIEELTIHACGEELHVTMTFGLEDVGRDQSLEDVLEAADRKLYMGKARGRNQVVL